MLSQLLEQFTHTEFQTRNPATVMGYARQCRAFLRSLGTEPLVADFTRKSAQAFIDHLGNTRRPRTCRRHLAAIRAFGDWLVTMKQLEYSPAESVKAPRMDPPRRDRPTTEQVIRMRDACTRIENPYRQALMRAVVSTFIYSACRRAELLALNLDDVDHDRKCIEIRHGKGNRARAVPIDGQCYEAIAAYLELRPACAKDALFLIRKGMRLGDGGLRTLLRQVMTAADMRNSKALLPHGLRHAAATRMHQAGYTIEDLQPFLGHSDPATTGLYLHTDAERQRVAQRYAALPGDPGTPTAAPPPPELLPPTAIPAPTKLRMVSGGIDPPRTERTEP